MTHPKCDNCQKERMILDSGLCHECNQAEIDACKCAECNLEQSECICADGPYIPGGYRL